MESTPLSDGQPEGNNDLRNYFEVVAGNIDRVRRRWRRAQFSPISEELGPLTPTNGAGLQDTLSAPRYKWRLSLRFRRIANWYRLYCGTLFLLTPRSIEWSLPRTLHRTVAKKTTLRMRKPQNEKGMNWMLPTLHNLERNLEETNSTRMMHFVLAIN